ncbi:hypothetical protein P153DRAFT_291832 [Dothidotthia symphoricarpi CBS 119687]|uniref:Zn(2)-C6 fungal-type domain-containing protein n=1 Tax=Dothidotthia symphoricarpi CBS 119687 TaxID=1392245 RepID=A0A6A6AC99_9PLEO|nr:uncharacterized protein P153DRAFT_291832 [Dothidotthia symphoricarpi CBS 119687]KAF2128765.1 hypothetical protein P153DRAFT_291832 [Dothidotthia symphoricarpi CBS 119687]
MPQLSPVIATAPAITTQGRKRQRQFSPKTRNGCKTCKIRRTKCDEEKPYCNRCTSTGRICDGYDSTWTTSTFKATQSRSRDHASPSSELVRTRIPVLLAPSLQLDSVQERESFEFFITHAMPSLRGVLSSPFWQREILQAAHQHPSIQYGIIALGAMHRRYQQGSTSHIEKGALDKHLHFALQHSNRAIQGLVKNQGPRGDTVVADKRTLMTCCILFNSMACLQGHQREALQHLRSGLRMLKEADEAEAARDEPHPIDIESLRSIFVGLDMQARSIMSQSDFLHWEPPPATKDMPALPRAELSDSSLLAMLQYLESLQNHVLNFLQGTNERLPKEKHLVLLGYQDLMERFKIGSIALDRLCNNTSSTQAAFAQPLSSLRLLHCQIEYLIRSPRGDLIEELGFMHESNNMPFDLPAHFTKMMALITHLLPDPSDLTPVFTTAVGPLAALWLVATSAPSTCIALRRRAVALMLSYPRREGYWDGLVAGQIAREVLRLEQESTRAELGLPYMEDVDLVVPDHLRIVVVALSYSKDDDRKAKVEFRNARAMMAGEPGTVQQLSW